MHQLVIFVTEQVGGGHESRGDWNVGAECINPKPVLMPAIYFLFHDSSVNRCLAIFLSQQASVVSDLTS